MKWRIYQCRECTLILGVGTTFPDDGVAKHQAKDLVHTKSALYETSNSPPLRGGAKATLKWAADQIESGEATKVGS